MAHPADMVALLDALVSSRVYRSAAKEGATVPYIVFSKIAGNPVNNLAGTDGQRNTRYQIDAWAADADAAEALMLSIKAAFGAASIAATGTDTQYIELPDNPDLYDDDAKLHRASADFSVWHT